jgi:hypothetical protein
VKKVLTAPILRNENGNIIAVFKPEDEQGDSPKNPKLKVLESKFPSTFIYAFTF